MKTYIELMYLDFFCNGILKFIVNSRSMKKKSNFKIFRIVKSMSNLICMFVVDAFSCFCQRLLLSTKAVYIIYYFTIWAILLMISFEDLILIFHVWVPNTPTEGGMKKQIHFKQHFATTFRRLTRKFMISVYQST